MLPFSNFNISREDQISGKKTDVINPVKMWTVKWLFLINLQKANCVLTQTSIQLMEIQELGLLNRREEERKNAFFKSYYLHEKLLWKKKRNKQLIAFSINCIPRSCWPTGGKGLHRVINNNPPGLLVMTHYFVTEGTLGSWQTV